MKNNIDNKSNLDRYFEIAKNEKIAFSKENASNILAKYSNNKVGFWARVASRLSLKLKISAIATLSLISFFLLVNNDSFDKKSEFNNSENVSKKSTFINSDTDKNEVNESSNLVILNKTNKIKNDIITIREENNTNQNNDKINTNVVEKEKIESLNQTVKLNDYAYVSEINNKISSNEIYYEIKLEKSQYKEFTANEQFGGLKTLAFDFSKHNGFSISFLSNITSFGGLITNINGGRLLWTMNKDISLGVIGFGGKTPESLKFTDDRSKLSEGEIVIGYGGLFLEYTLNPEDFVQFSVNTTIGGGGFNYKKTSTENKPWAAFMMIEPGASLEFKLSEYIRAGMNFNYKVSHNFQDNRSFQTDLNYKNLKLNGLSGGIFFKLGIF